MPNPNNTKNNSTRARNLSITVRIGESIGFRRGVIDILGKPAQLYFWWGEDEKVLAISGSNESTEISVFVPTYFYGTSGGTKIRNQKLMKAVQTCTGWKNKSVHRLKGEFIPEFNMIAFKINNTDTEVKVNV